MDLVYIGTAQAYKFITAYLFWGVITVRTQIYKLKQIILH
jgi:hypothetical protein